MADVSDPRFTSQQMQNPGGGGTYVDQVLNEVRRLNGVITNPTAARVWHDAISLLETAATIERQGIGGPEQQQYAQQYAQSFGGGMQQARGFGGGGLGPSNAGR